jgi:hypothetical protein
MSETCTAYLRRLPPDVAELGRLIDLALTQQGSPSRRFTLAQAAAVAAKLLEDLARAETAQADEQ